MRAAAKRRERPSASRKTTALQRISRPRVSKAWGSRTKLIVKSTALHAAYFGWQHVIGQVLFNIEENRRVVSAPANDCIAFP